MKLSEIIRRAIDLGRKNGFVTFDQFNELVPAATTEPEEIEIVMEALSDAAISVQVRLTLRFVTFAGRKLIA